MQAPAAMPETPPAYKVGVTGLFIDRYIVRIANIPVHDIGFKNLRTVDISQSGKVKHLHFALTGAGDNKGVVGIGFDISGPRYTGFTGSVTSTKLVPRNMLTMA
jgi:hypothetical protein